MDNNPSQLTQGHELLPAIASYLYSYCHSSNTQSPPPQLDFSAAQDTEGHIPKACSIAGTCWPSNNRYAWPIKRSRGFINLCLLVRLPGTISRNEETRTYSRQMGREVWSNIFVLARKSTIRHPLRSQRREGFACLSERNIFLPERLPY